MWLDDDERMINYEWPKLKKNTKQDRLAIATLL